MIDEAVPPRHFDASLKKLTRFLPLSKRSHKPLVTSTGSLVDKFLIAFVALSLPAIARGAASIKAQDLDHGLMGSFASLISLSQHHQSNTARMPADADCGWD
jgi:hypothetical protein